MAHEPDQSRDRQGASGVWWRDASAHALNVRTNHIRAVLSGSDPPEAMLTSLKAWATRRLAESGLIECGAKVWTHGGSTRYLWTTDDVAAASWYVLDGQRSGLGSAAAVKKSAAGRSLPVAAQIDHPWHGLES